MTTFTSPEAEAAYVLADHGLADSAYGCPDGPDGWNAIVHVNLFTLTWHDETDLVAQLRTVYMPPRGWFVWIQQDVLGSVSIKAAARIGADTVDLARAFDARRKQVASWTEN